MPCGHGSMREACRLGVFQQPDGEDVYGVDLFRCRNIGDSPFIWTTKSCNIGELRSLLIRSLVTWL